MFIQILYRLFVVYSEVLDSHSRVTMRVFVLVGVGTLCFVTAQRSFARIFTKKHY